MAYPRFQMARAHKFATRTAGSLATSASWADVDLALDLTLGAQPGDVIEYGVSALWGNEATPGRLDVLCVASARTFSGSNFGVSAWYAPASLVVPSSGAVVSAMGSADLIAGQVTLRLRFRADSARSLFASVNNPLQVWAKNLGPADST